MGFNFGNMNMTSEAIDKKLNDPNTTVEDLLKEEELLQEFRSQNEKLIDFFDKDKVKHLLDYIIKEQEDEQDKGYKFPFICSQIFGLELDKIMKYFFITNKEMEEEKNKEKEENAKKEGENSENINKDDKNPDQQAENKEKDKEDNANENKEKKDEEKKDNDNDPKKDNEVKEEIKKEEPKKRRR